MSYDTLTDRQLFVRLFVTDHDLSFGNDQAVVEASEAQPLIEAELSRRFGEGAGERIGEVTTATRMMDEEMIDWATEHPEQVIEAAKTGEVQAFRVSR